MMKEEISVADMDENIQTTENEAKQTVLARDLLLIVGTLLLGILFVTLFFENTFGVSIPIFVIAFYAVMLLYNRKELIYNSVFGWFLVLPILMLSLTYFIFANEFFRVLNLLALPLLIIFQTLLVTGRNSFKWHSPAILLDLFFGIFYRCMIHIGKPFGVIGRLFTRKAGGSRLSPSVARVLTGLLISLPIVLILIVLYEEAYGYTYLRLFTHAFMVFLFAFFIITLYRVWADGAPLLKPYIIAAIMAFVAVNYMNVDALIAHNNIERYNKTGKIDVRYLTVLSNDAIPQIAALAESKPRIAPELNAFLDNKKKELSGNKGWQSFNLADYHARKALE